MKKFIFIFSLLLSTLISNAQITFQKTFGGTGNDVGTSVQETYGGGYIITGYTNSFGAGGYDVYLIKTNANGDTLWTKTFGGIGDDLGNSVQQTTDGGYIVTGLTGSFGAVNGDVYLVKCDSMGNLLWSKTFGGANNEEGEAVRQTMDGGYIIVGYFNSSYDIYLIKTDSIGDTLWTKTIGGGIYDFGNCIQQTSDGGYIITGYTESFGVGGLDIYLIKINSIGNLLWSKTFGGTAFEQSYSVQQTTDGGYIIVGYTGSFGAGNYDVFLIKTDTLGNLLWSKTFGGVNYDIGNSVQQTTVGGYIVCGYYGTSSSDVYLIKTDANGDSIWTKTYGGGTFSSQGNSVSQTSDGGYIIVGKASNLSTGWSDIYLIKTDSLGDSGCNQSISLTTVTTPATQMTSTAAIVTSPATLITTPATVVGSGGVVTTLCTSNDINEITNNNSFFITPNPSTGKFIISFKGTIEKGKIEIVNIIGKNVLTENIFNESKKEINLKNISNGIYFVKVIDGENYYCKKIIIERD